MPHQTITMLANINTSGSNTVDNNLQHSTGNNNDSSNITGSAQAQDIKADLVHNQDQHHLNLNLHHHQHETQQQHQFDQQPTTTQQYHRQQPPQQNGPKPRGRRKKIRTEPIRPICPQCEKQFSNQSALTKHKLTHSDERKFACHQCSKAFKRHDHLTGHMQTHSNRKPFNCTVQGCDKTYCDARSLRRHKENIHHIVTQTQEPSHLLRRRIQRLHSDQGIYNRSVEHHQLNCVTAPPHSLPPLQSSLTPHRVSTTSTLTPTPNGNSSSGGHQSASYLNHHSHAGLHGSYSADYASTQHFNFDFVPMSGGQPAQSSHNLDHHHHHQHHHHSAPQHGYHQDANYHPDHQVTSLEHSLDNAGMPLSADSVTDSGLGLNVCYEQHTPQPLAPPPPPPPRSYNQNTQHQPHQLNCVTTQSHNLQPAQTSLTPHSVSTTAALTPTPHSNSNNGGHQSASYLNHHSHAGPHGSYSADYASTQHFNFDFVSIGSGSVSTAQSSHNLNHHHHSASQHGYHQDTGYHLDHQVASMEHPSGTGSIPLSADSVTDSGLGLNVYYEQHTPQPLAPQPPSFRL